MLSPEYVTLATSVSPVVRVYWARTEVEPFTFRKDPYWTQGVEFNSRHFSTIWSCGKLRCGIFTKLMWRGTKCEKKEATGKRVHVCVNDKRVCMCERDKNVCVCV